MWKPDPGILTEAIRRSNGQPETSIYVGDNYYADVISARAAGMVPVLLDPRAIFPEADCRVIGRLPELVDWLAPQAAPDPSVRGEMPPAR
jgi:FMN phosphatase YigB (HAD superfamily)